MMRFPKMKKVLLLLLTCSLVLTACKSDEEKTTDWVLSEEGTWLVVQTEFTRTIQTQSTFVEDGIENNNAIWAFTSATEGNFEMTVPWRQENWLENYTWAANGDTARGGFTNNDPDPVLGGSAIAEFKAFEISKKQMRILMTYIHTYASGGIETIEMRMDADLRD